MGICEGGTIEDLALCGIFINFTFEPRGTKKNIDAICESRGVSNPLMRGLYLAKAEEMVARKSLLKEGKDTYVFSKDEQGNYFWKKANIIDKCLNYLYQKTLDS